MEPLPSSSSTTGMVSLILSLILCISKSIKQLQVCSLEFHIIFSRLRIPQMHMKGLILKNLSVCSYMLQKGKKYYTGGYPLILMAVFRHHIRFFPVDNMWVDIIWIPA